MKLSFDEEHRHAICTLGHCLYMYMYLYVL